MRKIYVCAMVCLFMAAPAICFGANGWYGSVNAGVAVIPDSDIEVVEPGIGTSTGEFSFDAGFTLGGAVGYMMEQLRFEGEVSYQGNDMDEFSFTAPGLGTLSGSADGDVSILTFLANGYFDFPIEAPVTPFITVGLGYSNVDVDFFGSSDDDNLFTYQLGAGVGYALSETMMLDIRYRYLGFEDYEISDPLETDTLELSSHNFTVGLRFAF